MSSQIREYLLGYACMVFPISPLLFPVFSLAPLLLACLFSKGFRSEPIEFLVRTVKAHPFVALVIFSLPGFIIGWLNMQCFPTWGRHAAIGFGG